MPEREQSARILFLPGAAPAEIDDASLARALIDGAPGAPREAWQRFAPMVHRILRRALGPDDDVEDLAQDVFLCLFEKVSTLREPKALRAFVISITALTARHQLRRKWARRMLLWSSEPALSVVHQDPESRQALVRFYRILDRLNAEDRTAFVLRFLEGLELVEVAAALDLSLATTKRRLTKVWQRVVLLVERDPSLFNYLPQAVEEGGA
jgi:RNA polymerase sigma-70 factor (ECF subfamily)